MVVRYAYRDMSRPYRETTNVKEKTMVMYGYGLNKDPSLVICDLCVIKLIAIN